VRGVGHERERTRPPAGQGFDPGERQRQQQGDDQLAVGPFERRMMVVRMVCAVVMRMGA